MLRFRLHPTPRGFALGIAVIAFWALIWLWFLYSLGEGRERMTGGSGSPPMATSTAPVAKVGAAPTA